MSSNPDFRHLVSKSRDAKAHGESAWRVQSTGEKLAVALILNRADWLAGMGYTMAEAIERVGSEWVGMIPAVAKELAHESVD